MSFKAIKPLWRGHEHFSVADAAALLAGFEPTSVESGGEYFRDPESGLTDSEGISDVQAAFSLITRAILAGSLPAKLRHRAEPRYCAGLDQYAERVRWQGENVFIHDSLNGDEFVIDELPDWSRSMVRAADVIAWLAPKGVVDGFFITEPFSQGAPIASGSAANSVELEALRQQLEQERAAREAAEQRAEKAEAEVAAMRQQLAAAGQDGAGLAFPYATKELEAMRAAVAMYWEGYTPDKRQPTQRAIGHAIGERLGLPPQGNGDPARKAIALAAAIKLDTVPDA